MDKSFSDAGIALLKQFESVRLRSYQDVRGVWTVGYGHTGKDVGPNTVISGDQALALLKLDVALAVAAVNHGLKVDVTQNQFDALVCFTFNVGCGAFLSSTLLKDINADSFVDAEAQFLRWDHAGSKEVPGLLARRRAEAALFQEAA